MTQSSIIENPSRVAVYPKLCITYQTSNHDHWEHTRNPAELSAREEHGRSHQHATQPTRDERPRPFLNLQNGLLIIPNQANPRRREVPE